MAKTEQYISSSLQQTEQFFLTESSQKSTTFDGVLLKSPRYAACLAQAPRNAL